MDRGSLASVARRRRGGFTLVELLVVIGIIALLISILLPALTRARQSAEQVKCMSNMKQIANAFIAFTVENKGRMPTGGGNNVMAFVDGKHVNLAATDPNIANSTDWIAWRRGRDPLTGATNSDVMDQNITYSALGKFLGQKPLVHTPGDYAQANSFGKGLEAVFRCPADNLDGRLNGDPARGAYRYSYSMNRWWQGNLTGVRGDGSTFTGKITSIRQASEKILLVDEEDVTLDDGIFNPSTQAWVSNGRINAVSSRHGKRAGANNLAMASLGNKNSVGNVGFCDGSVRTFSRKDALLQRYTGNPTADDPAFK